MLTLGEPDCVAGSHSPLPGLGNRAVCSQSLLSPSGAGTGVGGALQTLAVPFISHTHKLSHRKALSKPNAGRFHFLTTPPRPEPFSCTWAGRGPEGRGLLHSPTPTRQKMRQLTRPAQAQALTLSLSGGPRLTPLR